MSEVEWEGIALAFKAIHAPYLGDDNDPTLCKMFTRIASASASGQVALANTSSATH